MTWLAYLIGALMVPIFWFALGDPKRFYRNIPVPKPDPYAGLPLYQSNDEETK